MNYIIVACTAIFVWLIAFSFAEESVPMKVINLSGHPIDIYWVNTIAKGNEAPALQKYTPTPLRNSTDLQLESFNSHKFVVSLWDRNTTRSTTSYKNFRPVTVSTTFTKGPKAEEIRVYFNEKEGSLSVKQSTLADKALQDVTVISDHCDVQAKRRGLSAAETDQEYKKCIAEGVANDVMKLADSKSLLKKLHVANSAKLREYTCADPNMETSPTIEAFTYSTPTKDYTINVLFSTPAAKIMYTPNFITDEECAVLMNHGKPRLKRATVAAEDGSSIISENRKAQQASYTLNKINDPLGPLYERILNFTNYYTGYGLRPEGQEDFTIIQYDVSDQYKPHCDGQCDGGQYISGGRIATAVLYCKVPEQGGSLSFSQADVFVKPQPGTAAFFSYMGPNNIMDEGYTEHSSCPVFKGEKWATAVWMRLGVSESHPWSILDPQGVMILGSETPDQEYVEPEHEDELLHQQVEVEVTNM